MTARRIASLRLPPHRDDRKLDARDPEFVSSIRQSIAFRMYKAINALQVAYGLSHVHSLYWTY